ncbi:hypothetical protein DEO72_LG7g1848 [Vigna unguiculata]|uniref:Uncharacterized protein n=1 Tax=Vigna unguiculata TaxID=3917 RepID=A0A4D6MHQ7_VIGUN|nr:hypothetical protein DEO72_LG7g1848 [Vigna unguiculata]
MQKLYKQITYTVFCCNYLMSFFMYNKRIPLIDLNCNYLMSFFMYNKRIPLIDLKFQ